MIEVFGWSAAVIVLVSLLQRDHARLHALNIAACVMFLIYDIALSLPAMVAMNCVLLCISSVQLLRLRAGALTTA